MNNTSYHLNPNRLSSFCEGKFDIEKKEFIKTNSLEEINCCKNKCIDDIKYCRDYCKLFKDKENCLQDCKELQNLCDFLCLRIDSEGMNNIKDCAESKDCSIYSNKKCLQHNREDIINCCKDKCKEKDSIDCSPNDICEGVFNYIVDNIKTIDNNVYNSKEEGININLIIVILLIVIIFIFYKLK